MPDPLRRLSILHGPHTVDLALPNETPVGLLLPSIVDLVHRGGVAIDEGRQWHLSRVGQHRLDTAVSLHDNAIRDGELLLLTTAPTPAPEWIQDDPWHAAVDAADTRHAPTRVAATVTSLCTGVLGATALVWSGTVTHATSHATTGAAIATVTAVGAVAARRAHSDPILCVTLSVIAVVFAAAAGFLAVPAGPSTANSLLAAAVACSTSVLLLRLTHCGTVCLTALATFTALTSVASASDVAWTLPAATTGAALSALSLGTLAVAARLSIAAAGLAPVMATPDDRVDEDPASATPRAVTANRTLTGLVVGSSGAAALGAALVASDCADDGRMWPVGAAFAVVVGLVTVLRARTHIDMFRRTALIVGGAGAMASGGVLVAVSAPGQANWVCLITVAIGLTTLGARFGVTVNPLVRRGVEMSEYLALAAVVPLACWIGGLYGLIRGVSLP
jgi:type VII secretion integral membrane protein EccD